MSYEDRSEYCKWFLADEVICTDEDLAEYIIEDFISSLLEDKIEVIKYFEHIDYEKIIDTNLKELINGMTREEQIELCEKYM